MTSLRVVSERKKIVPLVSFTLLILFVILAISFVIWANNPLKATTVAKSFLKSTDTVSVEILKNGDIIFTPVEYKSFGNGKKVGIVFYPGGRVEHSAYAQLAYLLAEKGTKVIVLKVPFNFAFLRVNGADDYVKQDKNIDWFVSGHSLGGAFASEYVRKNPQSVKGLILLASYPVKNMSNLNIPTLLIAGTKDILPIETFERKRKMFPKDTLIIYINGANHAQFGDYGFQKGDGKADISGEEQKRTTITIMFDFISKIH